MLSAECFLRQAQFHELCGIEVGSLPAHCYVQMRSGGAAGAAAEADFLAAFYPVPFFYFEFGKMQVEGEQSLAMIEHDKVAFEVEWAREQNGAFVHGFDRSTRRNAEIQAEVRAGGFAVEDPLGGEDVRNRSVCGGEELS